MLFREMVLVIGFVLEPWVPLPAPRPKLEPDWVGCSDVLWNRKRRPLPTDRSVPDLKNGPRSSASKLLKYRMRLRLYTLRKMYTGPTPTTVVATPVPVWSM